jgi:hypothetical protein
VANADRRAYDETPWAKVARRLYMRDKVSNVRVGEHVTQRALGLGCIKVHSLLFDGAVLEGLRVRVGGTGGVAVTFRGRFLLLELAALGECWAGAGSTALTLVVG